jgi:hypothetical protein
LTQGGPISVRFDRRKALASVLLFAAVMAIGVSRVPDTSSAVILIVVLSVPLVYFVGQVLRRGPVLVFDDATFTNCKAGEVVPWDSVFDVHLRQRQGIFGVYHHLVFTIRREKPSTEVDSEELITSRVPIQTLRMPIDQLSLGWSDIVSLVQERLGKPIAVHHEAGMFGKTRISS